MLSEQLIHLFPSWLRIVLKPMRAFKDPCQHEGPIQIAGARCRMPIGDRTTALRAQPCGSSKPHVETVQDPNLGHALLFMRGIEKERLQISLYKGKAEFMRDFNVINTRGVMLDEAMSVGHVCRAQ